MVNCNFAKPKGENPEYSWQIISHGCKIRGLCLPLYSELLKKLTESYVVSNKKLKKALGIKNMPTSAEDGMKKTLASLMI